MEKLCYGFNHNLLINILYVFYLSLFSCVAVPEIKFLIWSSSNGEKLAGLHLVTSANKLSFVILMILCLSI